MLFRSKKEDAFTVMATKVKSGIKDRIEREDTLSSFGTTDNPVQRLSAFLPRAMDLIDEQEQYFEDPFTEALGISITNLMTNLVAQHLLNETSEMTSATEVLEDSSMADVISLYFSLTRFKEQYLMTHDEHDDDDEVEGSVPWKTLQESFDPEKWFTPYITVWLQVLKDKLKQWVTQAIAQDDGKPLNNEYYTSSVIDVYASCYQAFDTLKKFKLANKEGEALALLSYVAVRNRIWR